MQLNSRLVEALAELGRHQERSSTPYWWRKSSMARLAELGLTEAYRPNRGPYAPAHASQAYRLTEAGRFHLSGFPAAHQATPPDPKELREIIIGEFLPKCMAFGSGNIPVLIAGEFTDALLSAISKAGFAITAATEQSRE